MEQNDSKVGDEALGEPPELAWLPVGKLHADERYQRTLDTRAGQDLIKRIAANFSWAAFQAVLAAPDGNGGWWLIDGQHRAAAARLRGITQLPAVVIKEGAVADLARAFVMANDDRVAMNQFAKHKARRAAGDPEAVAVDAVCARYRIRIAPVQRKADELPAGDTLALAQFRILPKRHGDIVAGYAFELVANAYRDQPGGLRAAFFAGAAQWLDNKVEADGHAAAAVRAARALGQHPWQKLERAASDRRGRYGGSVIVNVAAVIGQWASAATVVGIDRARLMAGR